MPRRPTDDRTPQGYRQTPGHGPLVRSDVLDVYVFRRALGAGAASSGAEFLQLLRARPPLEGAWHPIMGHIEAGEAACDAARRELREEVGLAPRDRTFVGMWALEQVHPFYVAAIDCIVLSPRFAVEVGRPWRPQLNSEHREFRWVPARDVPRRFMWPGQIESIREIREHLLPARSLAREALRVESATTGARDRRVRVVRRERERG
ncbi:MAG: NUDIX domain-containing protein [Phycisphaerales bacterium]